MAKERKATRSAKNKEADDFVTVWSAIIALEYTYAKNKKIKHAILIQLPIII